MKKLVSIFLLQMFCSICVAFAQNVSVTVDNQYPGWLSSKIPFKDQESVKNLTVTGYINGTDVKFIRELILNRQLSHLNLSDAHIIAGGDAYCCILGKSYTIDEDNMIGGYMFADNLYALDVKLKYLSLPKSVTSIKGEGYCSYLDTLVIGGDLKLLRSQYVSRVKKYLMIREGVDSLAANSSYSIHAQTVHLPSTIKYLKQNAFELEHVSVNIENVDYFENLCFYYSNSPGVIDNDTIRFSKNLSVWNANAFYLKDGVTIIMSDNLKRIWAGVGYGEGKVGGALTAKNLIIHAPSIPPSIGKYGVPNENVNDLFATATLYVPKGSVEAYKKQLPWSKATIIEEKVSVTGVKLDHKEISFSKTGEAKQIVATVMPEDADNKNVLWTSSDANVASVENGKVTCTGYGTATISATTEEGGFVATCLVTATKPEILPTGITISQTNLTINKGERTTLHATIQPSDADNKEIIWTTEDNSIADVDNNGVVTGMKAGSTKVFATAKANGVKAECAVSVLQPVTGITLSESSISLSEIGSSIQLTAYVQPEDASNKNVIWTSSDTKVAIVSKGKVVCTGYGTAVISATTEDGGYMATCVINATNGIEEVTDISPNTIYKIYDSTGREIQHPTNGLNVIKSNNGKVIKFNIDR